MSYFIGVGSPGIPPNNQGSDTLVANCAQDVSIGDCVYISTVTNSTSIIVKSNPSDGTKMPSAGIVVFKTSPTVCKVQMTGMIEDIYINLIVGKPVFVGLDGRLTQTPPRPIEDFVFLQPMGMAINQDVILLSPQFMMTKIIS